MSFARSVGKLRLVVFAGLSVAVFCSCKKEQQAALELPAIKPAAAIAKYDQGDSALVEVVVAGLALKHDVFVYADTVAGATILDTLTLGEQVRVRVPRNRHGEGLWQAHGWRLMAADAAQIRWLRAADVIVLTDATRITRVNRAFFANGAPGAGLEVELEILFDYLGYGSGHVHFQHAQRAWYDELLLQILDKLAPRLPKADTLRAALAIGDVLPVGTGVLIPYVKSELFRRRKQYDRALAELRAVRERAVEQPMFFGPSKSEAALQMGELYTEKGDTAQALAQYHEVIAQCADVYRSGSEWNDWADQAAVREITELLANDPVRLEREADEVIQTSAIPAVKLLGYAAKIKSMARRGLREAMIDTALVAVQRYPNEQRVYYKTDLNLANLVTSKVFNVLEAQAKPELFRDFAERLRALFPRHAIGAAASYRLALLADATDGSLPHVSALYEKVFTDYEPFEFYDNEKPLAAGSYDARMRFAQLARESVRAAEVIVENAELRQSFMPIYDVKAHVKRGTRVQALHSEIYFNKNATRTPRFMKVALPDSTIGWMRLEQLKLVETGRRAKSD